MLVTLLHFANLRFRSYFLQPQLLRSASVLFVFISSFPLLRCICVLSPSIRHTVKHVCSFLPPISRLSVVQHSVLIQSCPSFSSKTACSDATFIHCDTYSICPAILVVRFKSFTIRTSNIVNSVSSTFSINSRSIVFVESPTCLCTPSLLRFFHWLSCLLSPVMMRFFTTSAWSSSNKTISYHPQYGRGFLETLAV